MTTFICHTILYNFAFGLNSLYPIVFETQSTLIDAEFDTEKAVFEKNMLLSLISLCYIVAGKLQEKESRMNYYVLLQV